MRFMNSFTYLLTRWNQNLRRDARYLKLINRVGRTKTYYTTCVPVARRVHVYTKKHKFLRTVSMIYQLA